MTQNPFGEGFDINSMLEQAQQMQSQMLEAQEKLAAARFDGSAGGVTVTLSGIGELVGVQIPRAAVGVDDDDLADLGDLIVAAYRDAKNRADAQAAEAFGPLSGGLGGGLGLPGV